MTRAELDKAAQALFGTGLFQSVNYRFQPKSSNGATGWVVTFLLTEAPADGIAVLDLPGIDSKRLWDTIHSAHPLVGPTMPQNDQAVAYYRQALESALRQLGRKDAITVKTEADLATGRMATIFQSGNRPLISALRFEGNRQISSAALTTAVASLLVGRNYSEREVRNIIDLNGKPLYEELGHLNFAVRTVSTEETRDNSVTVSVLVDDGPQWRLGKVEIQGPELPVDAMRKAAEFPVGHIANWKRMTAGISEMEKVLHRDGYLAAHSVVQRHYRDEAGQVDVVIQVDRGKQFHFGTLQLNGLSAGAEKKALALWNLKSGDPMNTQYLDEFLREAVKGPASEARGLVRQLQARPGSEVIDVVVLFK